MKKFEIKERYDLEDYRALIHLLRAPGGCPWDREQTHESIRRNLLEEAYEAAHAIDTGDRENLREELGDLLMQVLLHADMEEELGGFDLDDVADTACKKLVFRHPHVFGGETADDSEAVLRTWDARKRAEKGQRTTAEAMESVPENLPALWRAEKIQKKAADAGFAVFSTEAPGDTAEASADTAEALGDALFRTVNAARLAGVDPEAALHGACDRFLARFARAEAAGEP